MIWRLLLSVVSQDVRRLNRCLLLVQAVLLAAHGDIVAAEQLLAELEGYKTGSESDEDISQIAVDLVTGQAGRKAGGSRKRGQPRTLPSGALQAPGLCL